MSQRVKVATVVTRFQAGAGGVALRGALALDPQRYDVTIVAGSGDRLLERARSQGLTTVIVPSLVPEISPRNDLRAFRALRHLFVSKGFGVVHTHSAKAGALGRAAALSARIPVIVHTMHGFPFHEFQSAPRRACYVAIERFLGQRSTSYLAIGAGVAAETVRRRIAAPDRIRTVPPVIDAIDLKPGAEARRAARRLLAVPPGMAVVGTVGRMDYQKAPEHFVDALVALGRSDVLGIWIGDGPLRPTTEAYAREHGLEERFLCLGSREDVARLLPAFDVFVMSSRYEGLPCALIEAMTVGVPVVATAVNSVPDVVVPGETGLLVTPQQPAQMARAVDYLLSNPGHAKRMGQAGQARVAGQFSAEALGAVLEQAYSVGAPPRSSRARPSIRGATGAAVALVRSSARLF